MKTIVIGVGHKARQGKDTFVQNVLDEFSSQYEMKRYSFGDELKIELYDILLQPLHPFWFSPEVNYLVLPKPEQPLIARRLSLEEREQTREAKLVWMATNRDKLGSLCQKYGTYSRFKDEAMWLNRVVTRIKRDALQFALVADVRYYNEFILGAMHGVTVRVSRPDFKLGDGRDTQHVSETQLDHAQFDYDLINSGSLEELKTDSVAIFKHMLGSIKIP